MAAAHAHPAHGAHHDGDRFVYHPDFDHRALFTLDQGAPRVAKHLGVGFDLAHHEAAQGGRTAEYFFELLLIVPQRRQFLLDLDRFQPGELTQADVQDVIGLPLGEGKPRDQGLLGLIGLADDGDHLVDIEQDELAAFQDVDALQHFLQPVP